MLRAAPIVVIFLLASSVGQLAAQWTRAEITAHHERMALSLFGCYALADLEGWDLFNSPDHETALPPTPVLLELRLRILPQPDPGGVAPYREAAVWTADGSVIAHLDRWRATARGSLAVGMPDSGDPWVFSYMSKLTRPTGAWGRAVRRDGQHTSITRWITVQRVECPPTDTLPGTSIPGLPALAAGRVYPDGQEDSALPPPRYWVADGRTITICPEAIDGGCARSLVYERH